MENSCIAKFIPAGSGEKEVLKEILKRYNLKQKEHRFTVCDDISSIPREIFNIYISNPELFNAVIASLLKASFSILISKFTDNGEKQKILFDSTKQNINQDISNEITANPKTSINIYITNRPNAKIIIQGNEIKN